MHKLSLVAARAGGCSLVAMFRFLIVVASLVENRLSVFGLQ